MVYACVRESVRDRDIDIICEHSCRNANVITQCVVMIESWHCMCTYVGSSSCRRIPLLGIAHPVMGK